MDRHRSVVSKLFFDPGDGTKLSERGKCYDNAHDFLSKLDLPRPFQGIVSFYEESDGHVGYKVVPEKDKPFVELGFSGLREAIAHFKRFGTMSDAEYEKERDSD